jgi:hypothetical protein
MNPLDTCPLRAGPRFICRPGKAVSFASVGVLLAIAGCGASGEQDFDVDDTRDPLASAFGNNAAGSDADSRYTTPWSSPGVVNVCYVGPITGVGDTNAPDPTRMAAAHRAVQDAWQGVTGLTFTNQGKCPSPAPTAWISVFLQEINSNGESRGGVGSRLPAAAAWGNRTDIQTRFGDRAGEYRRQVAHEFGHALGMYHEMERAEADGTTCDFTGAGTGNVLGRLTPYDRDSIMTWSYCPSVRTETELLSPLDQLGGEMMYPKSQTGYTLACAGGCVTTSSGAIVRSDGAVTIDWVARGGNVDPTWVFSGATLQPSDGILRATSLGSESTSVTMSFPDAYSNPNLGLFVPANQRHPLLTGGGTVIKSDAQHTAVIMSVLGR